jgi:hypothetical protein
MASLHRLIFRSTFTSVITCETPRPHDRKGSFPRKDQSLKYTFVEMKTAAAFISTSFKTLRAEKRRISSSDHLTLYLSLSIFFCYLYFCRFEYLSRPLTHNVQSFVRPRRREWGRDEGWRGPEAGARVTTLTRRFPAGRTHPRTGIVNLSLWRWDHHATVRIPSHKWYRR